MNNILKISVFLFFCLQGTAQDELSKLQFKAEVYGPINPFNFPNATVNGFHFQKNFGFAAGVERDWKQKKRSRLYQSFVVGFYNEVYFERVITVETYLGKSYNIYKGLQAGFEVGAGYHRATSSNLSSVYEGDKWVSRVDKSIKTNRLTPGLSINFGYDLGKHFDGKLPITISASTGANVLLPYIPELDINLGLMRNNKLAVKYRF